MTSDRGSVWMIIITNVVALAIAWWQHWSLPLLLWPYWVQNVVIGWYSGKRMLALERFTTEGTSGFTGGSDEEIKRNTVRFFAMHYGLFHFGYLFFLFIFASTGKMPGNQPYPEVTGADAAWIAGVSLLFALTHHASFKRNLESDRKGCPNIGTLMFLPYARVVPMHIMIILGLASGYVGAILIFGTLKTLADVGMHWVEHRVLSTPEKATPKLDL